jgi:hypothetical protein
MKTKFLDDNKGLQEGKIIKNKNKRFKKRWYFQNLIKTIKNKNGKKKNTKKTI